MAHTIVKTEPTSGSSLKWGQRSVHMEVPLSHATLSPFNWIKKARLNPIKRGNRFDREVVLKMSLMLSRKSGKKLPFKRNDGV